MPWIAGDHVDRGAPRLFRDDHDRIRRTGRRKHMAVIADDPRRERAHDRDGVGAGADSDADRGKQQRVADADGQTDTPPHEGHGSDGPWRAAFKGTAVQTRISGSFASPQSSEIYGASWLGFVDGLGPTVFG